MWRFSSITEYHLRLCCGISDIDGGSVMTFGNGVETEGCCWLLCIVYCVGCCVFDHVGLWYDKIKINEIIFFHSLLP